MAHREEVLLPFPAPTRALVAMTTQVKGTWIASVLHSMRVAGQYDEYLRILPPRTRERILSVVSGEWVEIDLLMDHYATCDRLHLPAAELFDLGRKVMEHAQRNPLTSTARAAAGALLTPWTPLSQLQRIWDRFMRGGGVSVVQLGPKEARVELIQFPGCRYRHFQIATRGVVHAVLSTCCQRAFVTELPAYARPTAMAMRVAWA